MRLQRVRAAVSMALTWGAAWTVVGAVSIVAQAPSLLKYILAPVSPTGHLSLLMVQRAALGCGIVGTLTGCAFTLAFASLERRRSLASLSLVRVGSYGAIGATGVAFGLRFLPITAGLEGLHALTYSPALSASLGALSAVGSIALARRAPHGGAVKELPEQDFVGTI